MELFVGEVADQPMVYHAQRSYYEVLLRAGVRIYLYPAPYILHAKHMTIDDDLAIIGSSNMDMRSFGLNLEVTLMASGRSYIDAMRDVEDHYRSVSRELTLEEHLHQGIVDPPVRQPRPADLGPAVAGRASRLRNRCGLGAAQGLRRQPPAGSRSLPGTSATGVGGPPLSSHAPSTPTSSGAASRPMTSK